MSDTFKQVHIKNDHKVFQLWRQQNQEANTEIIPFFTLKIGTRRMGDTSSIVYNILSAKKDAELIKILFFKLGESINKP